jgi:beta-N-acetylhexosaminidase
MGAALAAELRACGIRLDFAPVVDVDTNPKNPVIGDRSFGADPDLVGRMGAAMVRGLQDGGVAACAKHFPGHGDTDVDSHLDLPTVEHSRERLEGSSCPAEGDRGRGGSIMTARARARADEELPATLSPASSTPCAAS